MINQEKHRRADVLFMAQVLSVLILECYDLDKEREQQSERVGIGYEALLTDLPFFLF